MEEEIKNNIEQPEQLEQLYRSDKKQFAQAFQRLTKDIGNKDLIGFLVSPFSPRSPQGIYGEEQAKQNIPPPYRLLVYGLF